MSYYLMLIDVYKDMSEVLKGYCTGQDKEQCEQTLSKDLSSAFENFSVPMDMFLEYPLFGIEENSSLFTDDDLITGEVSLKMIKDYLNYKHVSFPESLHKAFYKFEKTNELGKNDGVDWLYTENVGLFFPGNSTNRSGLFSFSMEYPTLGTYNYGFDTHNKQSYTFINADESFMSNPDEGCEGTYQSKIQSLYEGKFNCVYGQKYTEEDIEKLEMFMLRNPAFKNEEVYLLEPELPHNTTHPKDDMLYKYNGKFHDDNKGVKGVPLSVDEQDTNTNHSILHRLVDYCL